jgi:uncharacterized membrane-anchored protein
MKIAVKWKVKKIDDVRSIQLFDKDVKKIK